MDDQISILQVNTSDISGGAEKVALNLFQRYRELGYDSWLAVGRKHSDNSQIVQISGHHKKIPSLVQRINRKINVQFGAENFLFPNTWQLLNMIPVRPTILHVHNLHGEYFDLRALPWLSEQLPLIATLHDTWLLSGHCAQSLDCERWRTGCGHCPDLDLYPALLRDSTAFNWRRKQKIYKKMRLYLSTPSQWLMKKVKESILADSIIESRIIPNGVDCSIFHAGSRETTRNSLGIPQESFVLLFCANPVIKNMYKDYSTVRQAAILASQRLVDQATLLIILGEDSPPEKIGNLEIQFLPYEKDSNIIASYYRSADLYLHAAKAESWGLTITEALACGIPVVATSVGGIPEQIKNLSENSIDESTGVLVEPKNAQMMAEVIVKLLNNKSIRYQLGENAEKDAKQRFNLEHQAESFLEWYQEIFMRQYNNFSDFCFSKTL